MRTKQLLSTLTVVTTQFFNSEAVSESNHSNQESTSNQSLLSARVTNVHANTSDIGTPSSYPDSSSSSVPFPESTLPIVIDSLVTEQHTRTPSSSNISSPASVIIEYFNNESSSNFQSDDTITPPQDTTQSSATNFLDGTSPPDNSEAFIAKPSLDSSSFQLVGIKNCSTTEVDNIYTLYANTRSAFDLCVSASSYQIFPYPGDHPTQAQIQGMAESDACIAVFSIVLQANFPACSIGGMPFVSASETLLKISVDLERRLEYKAPSTEMFVKLLTWRYRVDLAKAANVPHDESSQLYAEFETNLDAVLKNTKIRVNEDLTVDVRVPNGSYETFEDAVDHVITDASAADLMPGYVIASNHVDGSSNSSAPSSSRDATGNAIESSATANCMPYLWSFILFVVSCCLML